jgi:hypothetical protein
VGVASLVTCHEENNVTDESPRSPKPYTDPNVLIEAPTRSIVWIAFWLLLGLVGGSLVAAVGPAGVHPGDYIQYKGFLIWFTLPLISLVAIVYLVVTAVRRAKPYHEQQASPEGIALQADMDAALGVKPYVVLNVVGAVLAVLLGFALFSVVLEFFVGTVSLSVVIIDVIFLLLLGLPAAGILSVALRRRASRRRITPGVGSD